MSDSRDDDEARRRRRDGDEAHGRAGGDRDRRESRGQGGERPSRSEGGFSRPRRDDGGFRSRREDRGGPRAPREGSGPDRAAQGGRRAGGPRPSSDDRPRFRPRSDERSSGAGERSREGGRRDDRGARPRRDDGAAPRFRRDDSAVPRFRREDGGGRSRSDGERGGARGGAAWGRDGGAPGRRSADRGGRFPASDRPSRERRVGRGDHAADERREGPGRHVDEPQLPDDVRAADLDRAARAELRTLSKENADAVARHLVMAGRLIDDDAAEAHRHALAAGRRAGRVAVVRESVAITAYAVGDFALALRELRTFRRISGSDDQIGLMVDSERGVGRPDRALELGRTVDRGTLPAAAQVALAIAMSGARLDLEDPRGALDELERVPADLQRVHPWSPALFEALAAVHEDLGDAQAAERWSRRAERAETLLSEVDEESSSVVVSSEEAPDAPDEDAGAAGAAADPRDDAIAPEGEDVVAAEPAGAAEPEGAPVGDGAVAPEVGPAGPETPPEAGTDAEDRG